MLDLSKSGEGSSRMIIILYIIVDLTQQMSL